MFFVIEERGPHEQLRLDVSEFRDIEYLHIRKYYQDFDEEWKPTKEGISMPLSIQNAQNLLKAVLSVLSAAESKQFILEEFGDILKDASK